MQREGLIELIPQMANVGLQFVVGSNVIVSTETKCVLADNNIWIGDNVSWGSIARLPLETTITLRLQLFSKEGDGIICGVGAIKLFDEYGYLLQGDH